MKKLILVIPPIAGVMLTLSTSCAARDISSNRFQPHFSGQAPGEAQTILQRFSGAVSAVDTNAMTLTVKSAETNRAYKVTVKTKFKREDKPAALKDAAVGKTVEVIVNLRAKSDEAITVNIKAK